MISNSMFAQLFLYVPRQSPCCHQSKYLLKNWLYRSSFRSCRIAGICWGCFNRSLQQPGCLQKRFSFRVASMAPWAKNLVPPGGENTGHQRKSHVSDWAITSKCLCDILHFTLEPGTPPPPVTLIKDGNLTGNVASCQRILSVRMSQL